MVAPLDFEKNIAELESKLDGLRNFSGGDGVDIAKEVGRLEKKLDRLMHHKYENLSPWEKVLVARHPERPHYLNFLKALFDDFEELSGDRSFAEDKALVGGLARFDGRPVMVLGLEKGHDTESRLKHNFGMPKPEGYRKARRLMNMANHFNLPLITFVDTSGAHPGLEAEERGQAEAIAGSIETMMNLKVPVIVVVTGEGGSGGAIAVAVGNQILMLEHAIYSVVSPEGCASILWRTSDKKQEAAAAQKFTAQDLSALKVIDSIIVEPLGGAHRNHSQVFASVKMAVKEALQKMNNKSGDELQNERREKFLAMGKIGL
ncbi:MAG: acetyl-CoA carboxylase carboxyltransferase subunit alpha [Alphaproteobacteria bacterium]|nr:acetyl-CoA carboxylase carboxyltransferase subunit alpha [Alphaproteobacteria bacterium]NCQ66718.1 acetyl-CoA carboxylase carboxyltransferase subunit alpha [Alphaproteobacteria bacterium]NCT07169.1 acetyl-CoA carboxylase carboxyltransferase subunit alpha [Alphaproteobacteria bacterium]